MTSEPQCPACTSTSVYPEGASWTCLECAHEWTPGAAAEVVAEAVADDQVRDAHGVVLVDGDAVVVLKDLKVKGSSSTLKSGTKVRNIRVVAATDGHNITCKVDGIGAMHLKSEFVKKA